MGVLAGAVAVHAAPESGQPVAGLRRWRGAGGDLPLPAKLPEPEQRFRRGGQCPPVLKIYIKTKRERNALPNNVLFFVFIICAKQNIINAHTV